MNKSHIIFFFLLSFFVQSQEVSPYYPSKHVVSDPYDFTSQITYFDMNYITNNISEFLSVRMNMAVTKSDNSKLLHDGGSYTVTYQDKIAQSGNANLVFN